MGKRIENLSNEEFVTEMQARMYLSPMEHELLDRLIRAMDAIHDLEQQVLACGEPTPQEMQTS